MKTQKIFSLVKLSFWISLLYGMLYGLLANAQDTLIWPDGTKMAVEIVDETARHVDYSPWGNEPDVRYRVSREDVWIVRGGDTLAAAGTGFLAKDIAGRQHPLHVQVDGTAGLTHAGGSYLGATLRLYKRQDVISAGIAVMKQEPDNLPTDFNPGYSGGWLWGNPEYNEKPVDSYVLCTIGYGRVITSHHSPLRLLFGADAVYASYREASKYIRNNNTTNFFLFPSDKESNYFVENETGHVAGAQLYLKFEVVAFDALSIGAITGGMFTPRKKAIFSGLVLGFGNIKDRKPSGLRAGSR